MHFELTPATTGASTLACVIANAVLEMTEITLAYGSEGSETRMAANVARVIDRELDNHWRSTQGATSARRSMVERLSEE